MTKFKDEFEESQKGTHDHLNTEDAEEEWRADVTLKLMQLKEEDSKLDTRIFEIEENVDEETERAMDAEKAINT